MSDFEETDQVPGRR